MSKSNIMIKWAGGSILTLVIVFGCTSAIEHIADEADQGTLVANADSNTADNNDQTDGFVQPDNFFTDAPVSPGGIAGDGTTPPDLGPEPELQDTAEETRSFFTAFQIDPRAEDTAGPVFVTAADIDNDGLLDLVTGWNESQPVQIHFQRPGANDNVTFRSVTLAGTTPLAVLAGVEVGFLNDDEFLDIVVLSKATGFLGMCPPTSPGAPPGVISELEGEILVYFNPANNDRVMDGDSWHEMILVNPLIQDRWIHNQFPGNENVDFDELQAHPENAGFTSLAVGDVDEDGFDDILVALNPGECESLGQKPPINTIDLWMNPGGNQSETSAAWGTPPDITLSRNVPVSISASGGPMVTDIMLHDVDGDTDLDVVSCWSDSLSRNVQWIRNPLRESHVLNDPGGRATVEAGFAEGGADFCVDGDNDGAPCPNGNVDCQGIPEGQCVNNVCVGGVNAGQNCQDASGCPGGQDGVCAVASWRFLGTNWQERPIGQIDTNANVLAVGDLDGDGFDDILVRSTPGEIVQWFRRPNDDDVIQPEFPPSTPVADREPVPNSDGRVNFPWPVFTLTEFNGQVPEAIAIGDVTGDGQMEVMVAAEGAVFWFDSLIGASVYDPWAPNTIIQDSPADADTSTTAAPGTGVGVQDVDTSTSINTLLVVDLDADGRNDILGTLDRKTNAGLSDDRIVWYRNTRTDDNQ